jgi:hypothetical protein
MPQTKKTPTLALASSTARNAENRNIGLTKAKGLAQYLETARETEPFDPTLFEPRQHPVQGEEEIEFDAEDFEDMRKDDIRQCTRDLLLVERAREWLLEE